MKIEKIITYIVVIALVAGGIILIFGKSHPQSALNDVLNKTDSQSLSIEEKASTFKKYQEIVNPSGFVNTENKPITLGEFVGKKVILIDFVTYSCINCQRTFPYLNDWYTKYKDKGLEIVAIHTPEFAFEHKKENVEKAFKEFGLKFPAVLDNDYATWNAYGNNYWPRKYLIDIDGYMVYDHIGEGKYEETEKKIIDLLNERNERLGEPLIEGGNLTKDISKEESALGISPETYLGSNRADKQYGQGAMCLNGSCTFENPISVPEDRFSLSGKWKQSSENVELVDPTGGSLFYHFSAGKVHLVADADKPVSAEIYIDGKIINPDIAGADVKNGSVIFSSSRLYTLVDIKSKIETHMLEIRFKDPGFRGYAFTFGR